MHPGEAATGGADPSGADGWRRGEPAGGAAPTHCGLAAREALRRRVGDGRRGGARLRRRQI